MAASYPNVSGVRFKDASGFAGYCVGDDQSIWSLHRVGPPYGIGDIWHRLNPCKSDTGHLVVILKKDGKPKTVLMHRLILETFVGPCPPGMECCHDNGIPSDNRIENLRWDTRKENVADARRHGTIARGSRNGHAKMTEEIVEEIRRRYLAGEKQKDLAREFGASKSRVCQAINTRTWNHVGGGNPAMKRTLNGMKRHPNIRERFAGKSVRIWSDQWKQWWRPDANGYTPEIAEAGVYDFEDAWNRSHHCGPGKKIVYVLA